MLATNNKYALLLPLIILVLAREPIKANKVSKVLIPKIVKLKKLANKID
jgi:hypothetical protein